MRRAVTASRQDALLHIIFTVRAAGRQLSCSIMLCGDQAGVRGDAPPGLTRRQLCVDAG
jgi:hypothetical protein